MFEKVVGVIHNRYIIKGGEDEVASNEYELLKSRNVHVQSLIFVNPAIGSKALVDFLFSLFNIASFFKVYKWLKKNKVDVLHVHNWFYKASPSIFWAAKFLNIPVVVTLHNYRLLCPSGTLSLNGRPYLESLHVNFPFQAIKKGVYRSSKFQTFWVAFTVWLHKKMGTWRIPKAYIVLTKNSLDIFNTSKRVIEPAKFYIKPNFITDSPYEKALNRSENFLFIGRLSQEKGIETLLTAFADLPYSLTIIGDGPLKGEVEAFAKIHRNISFLGFRQKPIILHELSLCTALIFPSIWLETFGLTIIEAYATGTPVIASNRGSASLIVENELNGLHFEPENVNDLKRTLKKWMELPQNEKEPYYTNARKTFEDHYTAEKNFDQLISVYQSVLTKNANTA